MLVTAVIPAYNYARFVCRAVDSVLGQTYPNLECLVVDDGSTDNTLEVLTPYADRVRVITQKNAGLSAARNTGIREATGEYVAFLDADDWWHPQKIERQMALATMRPELAAIGTSWETVDADLNRLAVKTPTRPTNDFARNVRGIACRTIWLGGSGSGVLARREVFDEVGLFDTSLRAAEDIDMWLRIARRYPIANVEELLATLCMHGTGSFRNAVLMEENQWKVYQKAVGSWPDVFDTGSRRRYRALILADAGGELVGSQDHAAFRKYVASLKEWPFSRSHWGHTMRLAGKLLLRGGRMSRMGGVGGVAD